MKKGMALLVALAALVWGLVGQVPEVRSQSGSPLRDLVGANVVVGNNPYDVVQTVGWVRDYHKWYVYEPRKDAYNWGGLDWFYTTLHSLGVKVMPSVELAPGWASSTGTVDGIPNAAQHAEYLGQLVTHYGDRLAAVENYNEPNQWWRIVPFPAAVFGAMTAGDYTAVKTANASIPLVLGGMAGPDIAYWTTTNQASGGRFDVVNFHWNAQGTPATGASNPESSSLFWSIDRAKSWRDANAPGKPIWITEFGWDTYMSSTGTHSKVYAPETAAANYLIRALVLMQGRGVEKGFVYIYRDPVGSPSALVTQYNSAGLVANSYGGDGRKKQGWYFLATLKNVLGDYVFDRILSSGPNVYHYEYFVPGTDKRAAVLWAANGQKDYGYQITYHGPAGTLVIPTSGSTTGTPGSTDGNLTLTERPVFVLYTSGGIPATQTPTSTATFGSSATATSPATVGPENTPTSVPTATSTSTAGAVNTATSMPTATATPTAPPIGHERLVNTGFEAGLTGWQRPSWFAAVADVTTAVTHSGTQAFRFSGRSSGPYLQQDVAAGAGQAISFSGWVNVAVRNQSMNGLIELVALSASKGIISTERVYNFPGQTSGWIQVADSWVPPAQTASVRVRIRFPTLDGTVYLDDLSLR